MKTLYCKMYEAPRMAGSITGNLVEVIGEQTIETDSGEVLEQFLYNILGYTPENGKPFAALKANIIML